MVINISKAEWFFETLVATDQPIQNNIQDEMTHQQHDWETPVSQVLNILSCKRIYVLLWYLLVSNNPVWPETSAWLAHFEF